MKAKRILLTGANGQIGTVLLSHLQNRYGLDAVVATDIRQPSHSTGLFELLDIRDGKLLHQLAEKYQVGEIYHLAAVLSAKGESDPVWTWGVNMDGLLNVLEVARELQLKVFFPSSIAVFGDYAPRVLTSQWAPLIPATVYGISKVAGEHWCRYYHSRYGVDVRSLRFPGLISYESPPGGGTTDYAVEIYHSAVKDQSYSCFLKPDTRLPMLYMPDALRAMTQLISLKVLDLLTSSTRLRDKLEANTKYFRAAMTKAGFDILPGEHPIVPVMLYDAPLAQQFAAKLLEEGIYVIGFFFPVVPKGKARIRVQVSAGHEPEHLERCVAAFSKVGRELGVLRK